MHQCIDVSKWQIPECQDLSSHGHLNVACHHRTSATRQCTSINLKDMSITGNCPHFKANVRSLLSRCTTATLRPIYTYRPLRSYRPYHNSSVKPPREIATKPPTAYKPFEDETLPEYEAEQFCPVNIGDTINSRYCVIGKLECGANSTVWFCRDLSYGPDTLPVPHFNELTRSLGRINMLC